MKKSITILIITVFVFGCVEDDGKMVLDVNQELAFNGTFQTKLFAI